MPINSSGLTAAAAPPVQRPSGSGKKIDEKRLKQAAQDFEALFINQLLQSMRRTVGKSGLLGDAPGKDVYQSLFDREISRKLAQQGGLGLGNTMVQKILEKEKGRTAHPSEAGNTAPIPERAGLRGKP